MPLGLDPSVATKLAKQAAWLADIVRQLREAGG